LSIQMCLAGRSNAKYAFKNGESVRARFWLLVMLAACGRQTPEDIRDTVHSGEPTPRPRGPLSVSTTAEIEFLQYMIEHEWTIGALLRRVEDRDLTASVRLHSSTQRSIGLKTRQPSLRLGKGMEVAVATRHQDQGRPPTGLNGSRGRSTRVRSWESWSVTTGRRWPLSKLPCRACGRNMFEVSQSV
jgi:hypothetical protein